jgi:hypothetical protein
MTRFLRLLPALLLLVAGPALTSAQTFRDVNIRVRSPEGDSSYGYAAYRFILLNTGTEQRTVRIVLADTDGPITSISGSATVPAGASVELPLYQPAVEFDAFAATVFVDGQRVGDPIRVSSSRHGIDQFDSSGFMGRWGRSTTTSHLVLASNRVAASTSGQIQELITDRAPSSRSSAPFYGSAVDNRTVQRSSLAAQAWPEDWLEYTRYLAVIVSASEFEALSSGVRDALIGAVHAGGNLMVLDGPAPQQGGLAALTDRFDLQWTQVSDPSGAFTPWIAKANLGFGSVQWATSAQIERASGSITTFLFDTWSPAVGARAEVPSLQSADRAMPVVDDLGVPRRMTFIFLVVFAILAGPVNLVLLAKTNRRTLLFVTAPLLGLFFSATVFVYGLLHDGISTSSRVMAVTLLDQRNQLASTSAQLAFYAPLTPRSGLSFSNDTEVTPMLGYDYQRLGNGQRVSVIHGENQSLRSGWIVPRQPAHFWLRSHTPRRERVLVEQNDQGQWVATNGLGVDIVSLFFCDDDGQVFEAQSIPAGQNATLTLTPFRASEPSGGGIAGLHRQSLPASKVGRLVSSPREFITRRGYIAVTAQPLFAPRGIEGVKDLKAREVVIGLLDTRAAAEVAR